MLSAEGLGFHRRQVEAAMLAATKMAERWAAQPGAAQRWAKHRSVSLHIQPGEASHAAQRIGRHVA
jgi:hypothetical protein